MPDTATTARPPLTRRQQEVLALLAAGKTDDEIAAQFKISAITVQTHISAIGIAWGIKDRDELCRAAAADQTSAGCVHCAWNTEAESLHQLLGEATALLDELNAEFPRLAREGSANRG